MPTERADVGRAAGPAATTSSTDIAIDRVTGLPVPLRFPWLNRRSQALEDAARRRAAFEAAPVLGDHLDTSA